MQNQLRIGRPGLELLLRLRSFIDTCAESLRAVAARSISRTCIDTASRPICFVLVAGDLGKWHSTALTSILLAKHSLRTAVQSECSSTRRPSTHVQDHLNSVSQTPSSNMSSISALTLRHPIQLPRPLLRIQRRWARVHDVRFVTTQQPSKKVLEKYKYKLEQKAKESVPAYRRCDQADIDVGRVSNRYQN